MKRRNSYPAEVCSSLAQRRLWEPITLGTFGILLLLVALGPVHAGEPEFVVRDLGVLGDGSSRAMDINEAGEVVGSSDTGEVSPELFPVSRAFLWLPSPAYGLPAGMNDLGSLRDEALGSSRGLAISDQGQIVGASETDDLNEIDDPLWSGFSWRNGSMTPFPFPDERPPYFGGEAVNDVGQVAATAGYGFSCKPFIWLPEAAYGMDAGAHFLPTLPGLGEGWVADINSHGQVVGQNLEACDVLGGVSAAFLWLPAPAYGLPAGIHSLTSDLPQDWDASSVAINDSGMVVGTVLEPKGSGGFVWQNGVRSSLPFLPSDLNETGWIVGQSSIRAVLWREGAMTLLDDLIAADSGWQLRTAEGINDHGQIVGSGIRNGQSRAVLLDLAAVFADGFESGSTEAWSTDP